MFGRIIGHADPVGVEAVGGEDLGPGSGEVRGNLADQFRPGEIEQVVIALLIASQIQAAAVIGFGESAGLDLRAVGAILDQMRSAAARSSCAAMFNMGVLGAKAEQVADGVGQLGAVQGVEVEVSDTAGIKLSAQSAATVAATRARAAGRLSSPSNKRSIRRGCWRRTGRRTCGSGPRWNGEDAGHDFGIDAHRRGIVAKAEEAVRREKNWVIARSAPASNLRQRLSRSAARLGESGCPSG
jgi:hypothetical protein